MTFDELEAQFPSSGFHDATMRALRVNWASRELELELSVLTSDEDTRDVVIRVTDLFFCAIEPPENDPRRGYEPMPAGGLRIGTGAGPGQESFKSRLPSTPAGYFLQWIFVQQWNAFVHICARDASLI